MLIKCVECGKDFSEYSDKCPECGCPAEITIEKMPKRVTACSICGEIEWNPIGNMRKACQLCTSPFSDAIHKTDSKMVRLPITVEEYNKRVGWGAGNFSLERVHEVKKEVFEEYVKDWDTLDKNCFAYKLNQEGLYNEEKGPYHDAWQQRIRNYNAGINIEAQLAALHPTYTCPTCGSTNVEKLTVAKRGISVWLFGAASNTINKSFKCKSCGYTW